jgi:uncharacterized protein YndB with AHSA1/START domain
MPKQKDLKRLVRARMEKTGEGYTAARLQLIRKKEPAPDYASVAGMSDAAVQKTTGCTWAEWVTHLDYAGAAKKSHREIVEHVASRGTPLWWSQMITVGYERIRGLREKGQRRDGGYVANRSRTFPVSVEVLFEAFHNARKRKRWLPVSVQVKSASAPKRMRLTWDDGTLVQVEFLTKGPSKSSVAVQHERLSSRDAVEATKRIWGEHLDRLRHALAP